MSCGRMLCNCGPFDENPRMSYGGSERNLMFPMSKSEQDVPGIDLSIFRS